jgi:DNA-binding beta-propeller fold protein YncE
MRTKLRLSIAGRFRAQFAPLAIVAILVSATPGLAERPPGQDYLVYVVCEAADKIVAVRFGPAGIRVDHSLSTGPMPVDINGPHGIAFSPDKQFYYVSLGHGRPYGYAWKYKTADDSVVGRVTLGLFPATMDVTPDGNFLYVVNFNLHGDMVPSSVSIVEADNMVEVARCKTCTMPHGSRFNPQGTKHYSACMMDDMLVEIDTATMQVSHHFLLTKGKEMGMEGSPASHAMSGTEMHHDASGHGSEPPKPGDISCSPTWAQPSSDGSSVFVACNKSSEVVEIDVPNWKLKRRIAAGPGVYNLAVAGDGKYLIGTNKRGPSISVFDIKSGKEAARIPTKRRVLHGAVVSPDDRYAFITEEGVGSEPGTVEVVDLESLKIVGTVDLPQQAAGIAFCKTEPAKK